jgi:hypothetical protein
MFYATRDFRHLEQRPSARFWASTLVGLAFWCVRLSEIAADESRCELAVGNRARSMSDTMFCGDEQAHHEQR